MLACGALHFHRRHANLSISLVVIVVVIRSFWKPPPLRASTLELASSTVKPIIGSPTTANKTRLTFYVADLPELTEWLTGNHTDSAHEFYSSTLNENSGEVWLHRAFVNIMLDGARTPNRQEADVILIPAYLHLLKYLRGMIAHRRIEAKMAAYPDAKEVAELVANRVAGLGQQRKPHVLLVPTTNPSTSLSIGLAKLVAALEKRGVNLFSVGYERNTFWQRLPPARILPIPYVVDTDPSIGVRVVPAVESAPVATERETLLFYAGDVRPHAVEWSGCNRSMVLPLINASSNHFHRSEMDIRLTDTDPSRLPPEEYNQRMLRSRYCLILCGDTPTSRSLSSSVAHMCIPLFVGSRLRGRCEAPCHPGWGWTMLEANETSSVAGATSHGELTHLPFERHMEWSVFPELNEAQFANDPIGTLDRFLVGPSASPAARKRQQTELMRFQRSFVYGAGSPIGDDVQFGGAVEAIWADLQQFLFPHRVQRP